MRPVRLVEGNEARAFGELAAGPAFQFDDGVEGNGLRNRRFARAADHHEGCGRGVAIAAAALFPLLMDVVGAVAANGAH
jgi:hypothetical protein